jgi:hypothetical protein
VVDHFVEAAIEVDERPCRPQTPGQVFAREKLSRLFEKREQELKRLVAKERSAAIA